MRARLSQLWESLHSSYWFIPSVMAVGAVLLSFASTILDGYLGSQWMQNVNWFWSNKPEGARAVLSTVAGSMITVAGVTFSVTIASVSYTSSQFAPRLLTNFMQDRGNQVTLGTFVATYIYCLLVLRTVRSGADLPPGADAKEAASAFVPHVSLTLALLLALASVGVLIYFMHHVPESIHVSNVVAGIGQELNHQIEKLFPSRMGDPPPEDDEEPNGLPPSFAEEAVPIASTHNGYLQNLQPKNLLEAAKKHDLLLEMLMRPGDHVIVGQPVILAWPPDRVNEQAAHGVRGAFLVGARRTPARDAMFLVNELVEIAARALSPGINDPFTAIGCMHWLKSALATAARRRPPAIHRYDDDGRLRVVAPSVSFRQFAEAGFQQLRPYAATDRNAALAFLQCLSELVVIVESDRYRQVLGELALELKEQALEELGFENDRRDIEKAYAAFLRFQENHSQRELAHERRPDGSG